MRTMTTTAFATMAGTMAWPNDVVVPFAACGDLSGYDADMSYDLDAAAEGAEEGGVGVGYTPLEPVAPPIAPPYKTAIAKERERAEQQRK